MTTSASAENAIGWLSICQASEPLRPSIRPDSNFAGERCPSKSSLASSNATSSRTFSAFARVPETKRVNTAASSVAMVSATSASANENPAVPLRLPCLDNIIPPIELTPRL
jgi:hypothetical protein